MFKVLAAFLICLFSLALPVFTQRLVFDSSFMPIVNGIVEHFELLSDGKMLIAGDFTTVNGTARKEIARLNADGSLDTSFNADWLGGSFNQSIEITAIRVLPDGKILVGGDMPFDGSGGTIRVRRLNADGSSDTTQTATPRVDSSPSSFEEIIHLDQLPNGKMLVCGNFDLANNNPKPNLARYNNDGTFDPTFATTITGGDCNDIEILPDGKYIVAGVFNTVNGNASHGLLRFNSDDSVDTGFVIPTLPNTTGTIRSTYVERQSDGSIFANMYATGSISGNEIARLNADGSLQQFFPGEGNELLDVLVQPNGKTLLSIDENFRRINTDGTTDASLPILSFFGSVSNSPHEPRDMALTPDGKLVVTGTFTQFHISGIGTTNRQYLARFTLEAIPVKPKYDFDGDGKDDIALFRPSDRIWYLNRSTAGFYATQFGLSTDTPIAYDHDGDGRADIAVFRDGAWYWLRSIDGTFAYKVIGQSGDIPIPSSFNAYGLVYRPSAASFYTRQPFQNETTVSFPMTLLSTDKPVVADYDGDGRDDMAVFRDGHWFVRMGFSNQVTHYQFGLSGDKAVPADYDGDGRADYAVFRPSNGTWYIKKSNEGFFIVQWGIAEDIPVPADYDGDGRTDIAVFRPSTGVWYQMRSTDGFHIEPFGLSGDIPAQAR